MESFYCDVLPLHPQPQPLESFTSYISRLSEANGLKSVEEIARLLFPGTNVSSNNIRHLADFPLTSFGVLPTVSVCPDPYLLKTTFFHLARKFGRNPQNLHLSRFLRDAIALHLRYCPHCLVSQPAPYYSLLWRFLHLTNCPYHHYPLLEHCIHCGSKIPLFVIPPKIPFCISCKKDLRLHRSSELKAPNEQVLLLSIEELEFLLSPHECELEENLSFLLSQRLAYRKRAKGIEIIPSEAKWLITGVPKREQNDEDNIEKFNKATFLNYLNYLRLLGLTFNELFNKDFFTTLPDDKEEHDKHLFVLVEKLWETQFVNDKRSQ